MPSIECFFKRKVAHIKGWLRRVKEGLGRKFCSVFFLINLVFLVLAPKDRNLSVGLPIVFYQIKCSYSCAETILMTTLIRFVCLKKTASS